MLTGPPPKFHETRDILQWSSLDRLEDTVNPGTPYFQEPRAISGVAD
jgi:hypothetical protein